MIGCEAREEAGHGAKDQMNKTETKREHRQCKSEGESRVSLSHHSMNPPLIFKKERKPKPGLRCGSECCTENLIEDHDCCRTSVEISTLDLEATPTQQPQDLDTIFMTLEKDIMSFVKEELKRLKSVLNTGSKNHQCPDEHDLKKNREQFLEITLNFMRALGQEQLANHLQSECLGPICKDKLKSRLQQKFSYVFEGITKAGNPTLLNQIYTELYVTEGGVTGVNQEHEVRQIETTSRKQAAPETIITCEDIFKDPAHRQGPIRTVLTKGVAGIGKTVLTQKFSLDWAEGRANQDIQLLFPFTFRELNVLRDREFSLVGLLQHFFSESKGLCSFQHLQVVFIFDSLDECRLPLDFTQTQVLTDPTESSSVDVLLVNLIRGDLLSSARLWITTRPAAANQIPAECVSMVTEVRGFTESQKEQYFRKRFRDEEQASDVISHIKKSHSLHVMCYIPIFSWIISTVLENIMKTTKLQELPQTLTNLYIHFLVIQLKRKNVKYDKKSESISAWSPENKKMVESLGKLAFEQLQKGNLIFYESDLMQCALEPTAASVYSGVFTQVFREEPGLYQDKVYCFIHLSVQEFLAALHVHQTFVNTGVNLLNKSQNSSGFKKLTVFKTTSAHMSQFYWSAVDQALKSPNGHLDLFLRFLLGLSLPTNQSLLQGLLTQTGSKQTNKKTIKYMREIIRKHPSEQSLSLLHCLHELNDQTLPTEIQLFLKSGYVHTDRLSPDQWSILVFLLLSSQKNLDKFDLRKYGASEQALLKLLPVVKVSTKTVLSGCEISWRSCQALSALLRASSSNLREPDLSNNELKDCGVKLLSAGLEDPLCTLERLTLSGCGVSDEGCIAIVSALRSNPSHLRELDLSYNHPGDAGVRELTAGLHNPLWRLDTLSLDNYGELRLRPGPRKFYCELTLDADTAYRKLHLSNDLQSVTTVKQHQPYPDHPHRFDYCPQVLCLQSLIGCCYWEVQWEGVVHIAVSDRAIRRKGNNNNKCRFGMNAQSWCLSCSKGGYSVWHDDRVISLAVPVVGVFLDSAGGCLSFYRVSSEGLTHLHSFNAAFTKPLFAGFGIGFGFGISSDSGAVSLVEPL